MPSLHISISDEEYYYILEAARANNVKPQEVIRKIITNYREFRQKLETHLLLPITDYEELKKLEARHSSSTTTHQEG